MTPILKDTEDTGLATVYKILCEKVVVKILQGSDLHRGTLKYTQISIVTDMLLAGVFDVSVSRSFVHCSV